VGSRGGTTGGRRRRHRRRQGRPPFARCGQQAGHPGGRLRLRRGRGKVDRDEVGQKFGDPNPGRAGVAERAKVGDRVRGGAIVDGGAPRGQQDEVVKGRKGRGAGLVDRGNDSAPALVRQGGQRGHDLARLEGIQPRGRFIREEQVRLAHQLARDGQALAFPARNAAGPAPADTGTCHARQAQAAEQGLHLRRRGRRQLPRRGAGALAVILQGGRQGQRFPDGQHGVECVLLFHISLAPNGRGRRRCLRVGHPATAAAARHRHGRDRA
jgi:hypothetical protein